MEIYLTDLETHEYIGSDFADPSPLEEGVFIIPAGAYADKPPTAEEGKTIIRNNDKWESVDDHRNSVLYLVDPSPVMNIYQVGTEFNGETFDGLGELPNWLTLEYAEYQLSPEELSQSISNKRDKLIEDVRWRIERHRDEKELDIEVTEDIMPILIYVQALREVPQQEGFPDNVIWPEL